MQAVHLPVSLDHWLRSGFFSRWSAGPWEGALLRSWLAWVTAWIRWGLSYWGISATGGARCTCASGPYSQGSLVYWALPRRPFSIGFSATGVSTELVRRVFSPLFWGVGGASPTFSVAFSRRRGTPAEYHLDPCVTRTPVPLRLCRGAVRGKWVVTSAGCQSCKGIPLSSVSANTHTHTHYY